MSCSVISIPKHEKKVQGRTKTFKRINTAGSFKTKNKL